MKLYRAWRISVTSHITGQPILRTVFVALSVDTVPVHSLPYGIDWSGWCAPNVMGQLLNNVCIHGNIYLLNSLT